MIQQEVDHALQSKLYIALFIYKMMQRSIHRIHRKQDWKGLQRLENLRVPSPLQELRPGWFTSWVFYQIFASDSDPMMR